MLFDKWICKFRYFLNMEMVNHRRHIIAYFKGPKLMQTKNTPDGCLLEMTQG